MTARSFDPTTFPVVPKGHKFEDFDLGRAFAHHWGRTLTMADSVLFSSTLCFWNPLVLNVPYAKSHGHPDVVINPMLVLCTAVGMSVEDLSEAGGPFLGLEDCTFHAPVYPGDTIRAVSTVASRRESESRPTDGIVTWRTDVFNQHDDIVVSYQRTNIVAKRGQSEPARKDQDHQENGGSDT